MAKSSKDKRGRPPLHKRSWFVIPALVLLIFVLLIATLAKVFRVRHHNDPLVYGASFSKVYAEELGLDWQAAYTAIFSELNIKQVRIMSYWDQLEPEPGKYNFADLDKQFELAQQHDGKLSLAIGLRQPRWPECRQPTWANQLDQPSWQAALSGYIAKVVERYRHHPALDSYQLENEYFNRDFGINCRNFSRQRLLEEFDLVKQLDPHHPVIMNQSNQIGLPINQPKPEIFGFSVYKRVYEARLLKRYITHPVPAWYHSFRAELVEFTGDGPVIIHELQAEPWVTKPITQVPLAEQQQTMSTTQLQRNLDFAERTGIKTQYLWGAEWWYWQKTHHHNSSYWDVIRQAVQNTQR